MDHIKTCKDRLMRNTKDYTSGTYQCQNRKTSCLHFALRYAKVIPIIRLLSTLKRDLLGVIMSDRKKILIVLFLAFIIFPISPLCVNAAKGVLSDEAQTCLGCHSNKDMTKQLDNKEILSLYVNGDNFGNSVHNPIGCTGCHSDISMENHPQVKKIMSKKDYIKNASNICKNCHPDQVLKKKPMHGSLIAQAKSPPCVECHGSHSIKAIAGWKAGISENRYCLICHKYDLSMTLSNGELLPLSVNEADFKNSVHANLSCGVCHRDFSKSEHPTRMAKSRKDYTADASKACTMCHPDDQLRKKPIHGSLMNKTACVECHSSHSIRKISEQKIGLTENQYCLICHKNKISMTMKNGEFLSLFVDRSLIQISVHKTLQCTDCHTGFSKNVHPVRVFKSGREYSILTSDICRRCHADASTRYEDSIHLSELRSGNLRAAACTDCHGFHLVIKTDKNLGLISCNKCHGEVNASYEASVHNRARIKGDQNAPVCSSCHNAHDVHTAKLAAKIKNACLACHKNAKNSHEKWLYNPPIRLRTFTELHFNTVACAACHAPDAGRGIYLILYDRKTGKPLPEEELMKLLGTDPEGLKSKIDINKDGIIDSTEIWTLFKYLYAKGVTTSLRGKMDVSKPTEAHQIADKTKAVRDCGVCHNPGSPFFKDVFLVIRKADGRPTVFNAKQEVLGKDLKSVYTILPLSKFYVLGSTNQKLFDILFIIALIGGIAVPIGHVTLRIITSPLRSLRRMGKGGKK